MTQHEDERHIRPVTQRLLSSIFFGESLTPATRVDFGIDSSDHYEALAEAVRSDAITIQQLDDALGNGPMLTALVNEAQCNPGNVVFETSWDVIYGRTQEPREDEQLQSNRQSVKRLRDREQER